MIHRHLKKNPNAGDTLEGISRWWLHLEKVENSVDDVSIALEILIKKGVIGRELDGSGKHVYRVCENN